MSVHLPREIERLKKTVLSLSAMVEENLQRATRALLEHDEEIAAEVKARDMEIDEREVDVEEDCLKLLALHQPVASDLRFLVATLKINKDLERIGDLAVNIAKKASTLAKVPAIPVDDFDMKKMIQLAKNMLSWSLDAFINLDTRLAHQVITTDDEVDAMKRACRQNVESAVAKDPTLISTGYTLLGVSRNLERIADHATNIAEDVIYLIEARIIRHE